MKISLVFTFLLSPLVAAQFTCSPTQPCEIGCCTKFGSCGLGPQSCGPENCISNCDRKSDCDPGWGPKWSSKKSCPLNVCCSRFGFCGTTSEFCGNDKVTAPSCSGSSSSKRTIGYYEGWGIGRPCDRMFPESIPIGAYTHLNFAFAFINPTTFAVAPMSPEDPQLYTRFTSLKNTKPGLETWISIGGWSMNDPDQPTATTFSDLAGSADAQKKFFASTLSFLETYGFDGVDLDWEYPVAPERSGKPGDFKNFVTFLQNFRNALHSSGHNYGLTITIPSSFWYLQNFDIVQIEKTIDWINVMSYDLHGTWDSTNKFLGPYIAAHTNLTEIDLALSLLWRNNINPANVVLGLGFYGRSFTLSDPKCTTAGCRFTSGANAGQCTQSVGTLSYTEVQRIIAKGGKVTKDNTAAVKMVVYDTNQWVSYDDEETLKMKVDYANKHCLGGTMVWAVSLDDSQGSAAAALSKATGAQFTSLLSTARPDPITSCQLGECGKSCPAGLSPAQRSDGKNRGNTGTNTGCSGSASRLYCCPSNDVPTCLWRGTAPFCGGKCHDGEVEVTSSTSGDGKSCWTGHKVLCCTKTVSDQAVSRCQWSGSAPFCAAPFGKASCPAGRQPLTFSNFGAGGEQPCAVGLKSFCCDQPPPYKNCDWYYHGGKILGEIPFICTGTCPAGKTVIATDPSGCWSGYGAFCCESPSTLNDPLVADFKRRIQTFASDPTCSRGQRQHSRRDLESRSLSNNLEKRSSLSIADFSLLVQQLSQTVLGRGQTYQQNLMATEFNTIYGDRYGLHTLDIAGFYNNWRNADRLSLTESLLCLGSNANRFLSDYRGARSRLCVSPCTSNRRSVEIGQSLTVPLINVTISVRNIADSEDADAEGPDREPSWALMIRAIINGRMRFVYEQVILTRNHEIILEIAWRLPAGNGPGGIDPLYQDLNPSDAITDPDRFVVFHFHVEHIVFRGRAYLPGIYAVVAFHGQDFAGGTNPWRRIDGNDETRNRRAHALNCNTGEAVTEETLYWYPGELTNGEVDGEGLWTRVMTGFGNYLVQQNLLTAATFIDGGRGGLGTSELDATHCNRMYLLGNYPSRSRMFGPNGFLGTPPSEDDQHDNDGV